MEKIELFEQYIAGTLSDVEIEKFEKQLVSDKNFAFEFKLFLISIRGICQEAEQENLEFGHALKTMSKDKLKSIIGAHKKVRKKTFPLRKSYLWISGMAAMFILFVLVYWHLNTIYQNRICDVVYSYAYQPIEYPRSSGNQYINLNDLTNEQIADILSDLKNTFENDEIDSQDWYIDGMNLAMAYLRLHRKSDAIKVLKMMAITSERPQKYDQLIEQLQ